MTILRRRSTTGRIEPFLVSDDVESPVGVESPLRYRALRFTMASALASIQRILDHSISIRSLIKFLQAAVADHAAVKMPKSNVFSTLIRPRGKSLIPSEYNEADS